MITIFFPQSVLSQSDFHFLLLSMGLVCVFSSFRFVTLTPGDVFLTGTPPGVGVFRKPPIFLKVISQVQPTKVCLKLQISSSFHFHFVNRIELKAACSRWIYTHERGVLCNM